MVESKLQEEIVSKGVEYGTRRKKPHLCNPQSPPPHTRQASSLLSGGHFIFNSELSTASKVYLKMYQHRQW
jgi:hypothetical protein